MNPLATVTITVYFVGLINFSGAGGTRDVVAPLATTSVERTPGMSPPVTLEPHRPDIVITRISDSNCRRLTTKPLNSDGQCALFGVSGMRITLPSGTPHPLVASDHNVPKLKTLCPAISGINREYLDDPTKYAVRLTLDSGTLANCKNGAAWGSCLTLADSNGKVKFEDMKVTPKVTTEVTLNEGAVIYIQNSPAMDHGSSGPEHFWWHYVIAKDAAGCTAMPTAAPTGGDCQLAGVRHSDPHPAASGLGCSNSQYP
jgi:hypothetical protein